MEDVKLRQLRLFIYLLSILILFIFSVVIVCGILKNEDPSKSSGDSIFDTTVKSTSDIEDLREVLSEKELEDYLNGLYGTNNQTINPSNKDEKLISGDRSSGDRSSGDIKSGD